LVLEGVGFLKVSEAWEIFKRLFYLQALDQAMKFASFFGMFPKCRHISGICTIATAAVPGALLKKMAWLPKQDAVLLALFHHFGPKVPSFSQRSELVKMTGLMAFSLL